MDTATLEADAPFLTEPSQTPSPPPTQFRRRAEGERVPSDSPLAPYVSIDAGRMHGVPCFKDSRVPIQHLFDHLRAGDPLAEFLDGFPPVTRQQAVAVIDLAALGLLGGMVHW